MPAEPFLGEIMMFGGNFAPFGWALCNGQLMAIAENQALFALIGTTYGGDGQTTFALPDLQGRIPVHQGTNFVLGQKAGVESVTLAAGQMPAHTHAAQAQTAAGTAAAPTNSVWAASSLNQFAAGPAASNMNAADIQPSGGSQPHENMMPFLAVNFCIALNGIFPSRN